MSATDELRLPSDTNELDMLLNERGQEHRVWPSGIVVWHDERTVYEYEPAKNHHDEYWGGILRMTMRHLTPEQAIAATLGTGTCEVTDNGPWGYPYVCSACGASFDPDVNNGDFNYCPNCGRRIEQ